MYSIWKEGSEKRIYHDGEPEDIYKEYIGGKIPIQLLVPIVIELRGQKLQM